MARGAQLITIYWRDIPAQVNAKTRGEKHQVLLKPRFQKAIDRAAMVADITTSTAYVNEWRQAAKPLRGDLTEAAESAAKALDDAFTLTRLNELVANGGFDPELGGSADSSLEAPSSDAVSSAAVSSTTVQPETISAGSGSVTNLETSDSKPDDTTSTIGEPSND